MLSLLKRLIVDWCLRRRRGTIGELFAASSPVDASISGPNGELKFISEGRTDRFVRTPTGWAPIKRVLRTVPYDQYRLVLEDGKELIAADEHLVLTSEGERHLSSLSPDDIVLTVDGRSRVRAVTCIGDPEPMYDLELGDGGHVFYTNGILSHNTTVVALYFFWRANFQENKEFVIASKNMDHAVQIMDRIKTAYDNLPLWLKAAAKFNSRTMLEFSNGSKIKSEPTSERTGRGGSPAGVMLDELAFVNHRVQQEMWASLAPSLATGGQFIVTSTPNGDTDLFATVWRGAVLGVNGFFPVHARWDENPDYDQAWYNRLTAKLGPIRAAAELDCAFVSSDALLINSMKLVQLRSRPHHHEDMGFKFWVPDEELGGQGKTYMVGVDPATGSGKDFTVIEVFEFPSLVQVAEWRSNEIIIPLIYAKLKWLLEKLAGAKNRQRADVVWSFERNGIGEAIAALYQNDERPPEHPELFCDQPNTGKLGVFTSGKTKILACLRLKSLVEKASGGLQMNSPVLLEELKNFVAKGGSYDGKAGSTDDCVMATVIVIRLLTRLAEYNEAAFNRVHEYVEPNADDQPDEFGDEPVPFLIF